MSTDGGIHGVNQEMFFKQFYDKASYAQMIEKYRCGILKYQEEDFVKYAHMKERALQIKDGDIIQ